MMCGIIGAVAEKSVVPLLLQGLGRLEYRGYDSAGIAVIDSKQMFEYRRILGKVQDLIQLLNSEPISGHTGIAHTRWATHGKPSKRNAHPHIANNEIAIVHNGIIENHETLRAHLLAKNYVFKSETDSELIAYLVYDYIQSGQDFLMAVRSAAKELKGAYSIGLIRNTEPGRLLALRSGSPLVIGLGTKENYIASDKIAISSVANQFIYLEDGDIADIRKDKIVILDLNGAEVERSIHVSHINQEAVTKAEYPHFMLKEIFEQPDTVSATLEGRITEHHVRIK